MAKKKKNKQTNYGKHKIEEAQRRNDYFKNLKIFCDMIHADLYPALDSAQRMTIYLFRGLPFKVVADGKVSKAVMDNLNDYARLIQKEEVIPFDSSGKKISLTVYHRYLSPLEWMIRPDGPYDSFIRQEPDRFKGILWYESFFEGRDKRFSTYYIEVTKLLMAITSFVSDLRYNLYYAYFEEKIGNGRNKLDAKQRQTIHVQPLRVERKHIKLHNGEIRNALRLTIAIPSDSGQDPAPENKRFFPLSIPPAHLGVKGLWAKKLCPVYISEHALNRLDERTGCASAGYMQMFLWKAILQASTREINDERLLLDFEAFDYKIGYLVVSIQRNSILIHTFLLLTASGTPEGRNLREQFGLQKADNQYLGIDKLSTFVHSNILQHEDVCEWFRSAGCESLLKVCEYLKDDELWKQDGEQIRLAERMKEYLKTNESASEWDFTEKEDSESEDEEEKNRDEFDEE
ncbi:MAG: hypothetical protein LBI60_03075 [Bacteroidales bacterium]|jgi:hypothetical protein|nr:hypothetical protein [Bacteroidales bacterium]